MFVFRVVQFLFLLIVVSWGARLLRWIVMRLLQSAAQASRRAQAGGATETMDTAKNARRLVRDPVCGLHVAEVLAIPLRERKETIYFCSKACRDKYLAATRKFAANG